jgi:hypothetical protein
MEDKWFSYFRKDTLYFHHSWTGFKVFEAKMHKSEKEYAITDIKVEKHPDRYSNTDNASDLQTFCSLIFWGLLGQYIDPSNKPIDEDNPLRAWGLFGRMITEPAFALYDYDPSLFTFDLVENKDSNEQ